MPKLALLSDIHSNLPALEAVVADMRELKPDAVVVLGDMINGCPWPTEVLDLILEERWPMLLGNHDDAVLQLGTLRMEARYNYRERYATLWWTREHLSAEHAAVLEQLPLEMSLTWADLPAVRLVHGIPGNFFIGLRPNVPEGWASQRLAGVVEPVFVAGHTHDPMIRPIGRWLVVNAGSVGMPYDGDVRASYAWLCSDGGATGGAWQATIRRVPYDLDAVSAGFERSGLLDAGGATAEMVCRSVLTGLPWLADFVWWVREQPAETLVDMKQALGRYDEMHGPGHWAFPYV
jgi:predicted phosphodiesterase